jgi:hypothetical protein
MKEVRVMTRDTTMSVRPRRTIRRGLGLAACAAAVALGAAARTAQASHDARCDGGIRFSFPGITLTWSDDAPRSCEPFFRGGPRFPAPRWVRQAPQAQHPLRFPVPQRPTHAAPSVEFERGLAAGWQLGERLGYRDGYAGRPECLELADDLRPRDCCCAAYLEGFLKGYRKGYHQGHFEGRQDRRGHCR